MDSLEFDNNSKIKNVFVFTFFPVLLFYISRQNYLLAHLLMEGWSIFVACIVYVMAVQTYNYSRDNYFFFIGHAFLAVAAIDIMHTLTYKGMGLFPGLTANEPTQFWIAARYVEALSFLAASILYKKKIERKILLPVFITAAILAFLTIMKWRVFPDCFVEGEGLTAFKIASEYFISLMLFLSLLVLRKRACKSNNITLRLISWSIVLTIISEMCFTLYADVYGVMNFVGHIFKIGSFYLIYEGILKKGLQEPYHFIYESLKRASISDCLSGLYNRKGFEELGDKMMELACRNKLPLGMIIFDLDYFKKVNDDFGHVAGDEVIRSFASILKKNVRGSDLLCRLGGDEFAILANSDINGLAAFDKRVKTDFCIWLKKSEYVHFLCLSSGKACQEWSEDHNCFDMDELMRRADNEMYREKRKNHLSSEEDCSSRIAPWLFLNK